MGRNVCSVKEPGHEDDFRIHFTDLFDFVADSRDVSHGFVAGSVPPQSDALWKRFRDLGVVVETQVRRVDGREVAVDKIIQLQMANRILDVTPPETIVLLTGDGSGYSDGRGLVKQLERARNHGWDIEVVS